jgi:hypothetical protein
MTKKRYQKLMRAFVTRLYLYTKENGLSDSGFPNAAMRNIYRDGRPEGMTREEWFKAAQKNFGILFDSLGMRDVKELNR